MQEFKKLCEELAVKLLALSLKLQKYNDKVERCNEIARDDFYSQYMDILNVAIIRKYYKNTNINIITIDRISPYYNLTPMEYIKLNFQKKAA